MGRVWNQANAFAPISLLVLLVIEVFIIIISIFFVLFLYYCYYLYFISYSICISIGIIVWLLILN